MAKSKSKSSATRKDDHDNQNIPNEESPSNIDFQTTNPGMPLQAALEETGPPLTTGRYIVIFKDQGDSAKSIQESLKNTAGLKEVASSSDYEDGTISTTDLTSGKTVHFEKLGLMIVSEEEAIQSLSSLASEDNSNILAIEPEYCLPV